MTCIADVQSQPVQWLWPSRFALGKLSLIVGEPGLGKSFLSLHMAATVSKGLRWPDDATGPGAERGSVIIVSAEDGMADTIRPRLEAAQADLDQIHCLSGIRVSETQDEFFSLAQAKHLAAVRKLLQEKPDVSLIVIDPITSYLGKTDSYKNAEVRGVLTPFAKLAEEAGVAAVAICHLNKNVMVKAIQRVTGSTAFVEVARTVWLVAPDSNNEERRLLVPVKSNLAEFPPAMAFRLVGTEGGAAFCSFEQATFTVTANEVLAPAGSEYGDFANKASPKRAQAKGYLQGILSGGPVESSVVETRARQFGISDATLKRARAGLGVVAERSGIGTEGKWCMALPTPSAPPSEAAQ